MTTYPTTEQTLDYSCLRRSSLSTETFRGEGKEPLDKTKVSTIKTYLSAIFTPKEVQKGINSINSHLRKYVNAR